ncbi:hypothetical protein HaLaN_27530 [Haematococcus lacustris]|uniref:Uncharacterized protein n=1 Tax=Haematococcus lacustris TaxID=44745 RepID=A0A6A0A9Z3_HAELA|nr:hypothetical protein HaLaN_27530 [Haematococcus lacustris]
MKPSAPQPPNACCRPTLNPVLGHRRTQMLRAKLADSLILLAGWLVCVDPVAAARDVEDFMSLQDTVLYARAAYYGGLEDTENNMKKVGNGQKLRLRISQEDALRINFVRDIYDAFRCLASTAEPRAAYKQRFVLNCSGGGKVRFHLKSQATEEILYSAGYVIDTDLGSKPYQHSVPAVEREGLSIVVSLRRASISFDDIEKTFIHRPVYIPVKPLRPDMPVRLEQTSRMYTEERHPDPGSEATTGKAVSLRDVSNDQARNREDERRKAWVAGCCCNLAAVFAKGCGWCAFPGYVGRSDMSATLTCRLACGEGHSLGCNAPSGV